MQNVAIKKTAAVKPLLRVLSGEVLKETPFWLMRQAGRYLPEYRALRAKAGSFLNLCFNPELAAEVTLQPMKRFDMDAAILFSDILVVPHGMGQEVAFMEGEGPRLGVLPDIMPDFDSGVFDRALQPVYDTVQAVRAKLPEDKTLIGFAGAPWTVACYMVQGQGGGDFLKTKTLAFENPEKFDCLIDRLTEVTAHYLIRQIKAGADVVQLFDSWAGLLPPPQFDRWVIRPAQKIIARIRQECPGIPVIGFPRQAGVLYTRYARETGADGIGLDPSFPLETAAREFSVKTALQGNLDPVLLLLGGEALKKGVQDVFKAAEGAPFIFNLGHGIIKETPPEHVSALAALVKEHRR